MELFESPLTSDDINRLSNFTCRLILRYAPFFKPPAFEHEEEWRLVRVSGVADSDRFEFRPSRTFGLVKFVKFNFKVDDKGKLRRTGGIPSHLIPNVIVGPGNDTDDWSVQIVPYELLQKSGLESLVSFTESSLRFTK